MNPSLEIVIPIRGPKPELAGAISSLVAQSDRDFSVLLCDNRPASLSRDVTAAQQQLSAAGIPVRHFRVPESFNSLEHWNYAHAHSETDWLKSLPPGGRLHPDYVTELRQYIRANPRTKIVVCDAEIETEWGIEPVRAPFFENAIMPVEFLQYFPGNMKWLAHCGNVAIDRGAWMAAGGCSPQLPGFAFLNLNVILALHHGIGRIAGPLYRDRDFTGAAVLNAGGEFRVNHWLELWLILRQARNYCLASKLPWTKKWLLPRAIVAMGRW